jgi:hypothetical protein
LFKNKPPLPPGRLIALFEGRLSFGHFMMKHRTIPADKPRRRRRGEEYVNQSPKQVERESDQGIERDERGQDQPKNKESAQR